MKSFVLWSVGVASVLGLVVLVAWLMTKPNIQEKPSDVVAPPEVSSTPIAFISAETGDPIFVTFGTSTAFLNGNGYSNLLFTQVEAATGAKYENSSENLSLWNKGAEVTLTRGRKVIFAGFSESGYESVTSSSASTTLPSTTSTEAILGSWLWVESVKGEETAIPKKTGVFSVTFADGTINGTTDCNGFNGQYTQEANVLTIKSLGMTKMFCEDSQEMEFTQLFIGSLTVTKKGTVLTLTHSDGTVSRFERK